MFTPTTLEGARRFARTVDPAPLGADHRHPFAILVVCKTCGSNDVTRDAAAYWDGTTQVWRLNSVQDQGYCNACGGEATLIERFTDGKGNDLGPISDWNLTEDEEKALWGGNTGDGYVAMAKENRLREAEWRKAVAEGKTETGMAEWCNAQWPARPIKPKAEPMDAAQRHQAEQDRLTEDENNRNRAEAVAAYAGKHGI